MKQMFANYFLAGCLAATSVAAAHQGVSNPATPDETGSSFAVSYGSYASQSDADVVMAFVERYQIPSFSEKTVVNGQTAWRVRLGPFSTRQQAESAKAKGVTLRGDVNAQILTLNPTSSPASRGLPSKIKITASELFQAYSENEVRGDQQYKHRQMLVTGQIRSIRSGLGGKPLVVLVGGGRFEDVYARDIPAAQAERLNRNQIVVVQCEGFGVIAATPQLKDCIIYGL
ncbi:OB-fold protein [Stenotrophomonas maltophilia]|uniref:OB-fold protein n=1 Tax=Stenotrophomonas maltophilia TaxID=40324 RepID=UPI0015DE168C|nr:SPOR domain-containing protein [Stenotrophomonas maltophilia]